MRGNLCEGVNEKNLSDIMMTDCPPLSLSLPCPRVLTGSCSVPPSPGNGPQVVGFRDWQPHLGAAHQQDTGVGDWTRERKVSRRERGREGGRYNGKGRLRVGLTK